MPGNVGAIVSGTITSENPNVSRFCSGSSGGSALLGSALVARLAPSAPPRLTTKCSTWPWPGRPTYASRTSRGPTSSDSQLPTTPSARSDRRFSCGTRSFGSSWRVPIGEANPSSPSRGQRIDQTRIGASPRRRATAARGSAPGARSAAVSCKIAISGVRQPSARTSRLVTISVALVSSGCSGSSTCTSKRRPRASFTST